MGASRRVGLLRRLVLGHDGAGPAAFRDRPTDIIDLRSASGDALETQRRLERLEFGMQVMAETMKRTYGRLTRAIREMNGTVVGTTVEDVQHVVADALHPVSVALGEVTEALRTIPYLMAAATDHVTERLEEVRTIAEEANRVATSRNDHSEVAVLPIIPFEMEPLDEDFDALTALRRARFAVDELDAEWDQAAS
jgi:hypothetical protein